MGAFIEEDFCLIYTENKEKLKEIKEKEKELKRLKEELQIEEEKKILQIVKNKFPELEIENVKICRVLVQYENICEDSFIAIIETYGENYFLTLESYSEYIDIESEIKKYIAESMEDHFISNKELESLRETLKNSYKTYREIKIIK